MQLALFLLVIGFPLLELALLIKLGQVISVWGVLAMIFGSGLLGMFVLQTQGLAAWLSVVRAMGRDEKDMRPAMLDGFLVALAGGLLIAPGVITDVVGLLLLFPPVRKGAAWALNRWVGAFASVRTINVELGGRAQSRPEGAPRTATAGQPRQTSSTQKGPFGAGPVIDGEFERLDERTVDPNRVRTDDGPRTGGRSA